jgi:hypothetical protein
MATRRWSTLACSGHLVRKVDWSEAWKPSWATSAVAPSLFRKNINRERPTFSDGRSYEPTKSSERLKKVPGGRRPPFARQKTFSPLHLPSSLARRTRLLKKAIS